ncbi:hypothetical protein [uncultured Croceitalea sp.]|uniref:hypothetical protein n=1 Tax=uncultured Croceitalea sp. TaxID=1798908 RepID=UPI003305D3E2
MLFKTDASSTPLFIGCILSFLFVLSPVKAQEKKVLRKQDFSAEIKNYKRSSLLLFMVEVPETEHLNSIKNTFVAQKIPQKFNDHTLGGDPFIIVETDLKDHSQIIAERLKEMGIARQLVAKWFNRNNKGTFNLDLVQERGLYNASDFDLQIAKQTLRGSAMLEDAGEHLIGNTFIIVNDYKYTNKAEVAETVKIASKIGNLLKGKSGESALTNTMADTFGKGYFIKTTSYLFRLKWDQEISNTFFGSLWVDNNNHDKKRVEAFNETEVFELEYVGQQDALADVFSTKYTKKTEEELIARATIKASNSALSKLERKFEVFRTKTPLVSIEPIAAMIGTKEGIKKGDRFEVLEQLLLENGTIEYKSVTEILVDKNNIWDNSYLPDEVPESDLEHTIFKGNSKKLYPGMLIRFKKNQNLFK